jgi:hypothetical protein
MIDSLRHDPAIRKYYQFWYFQLSEWLSLPLRRCALSARISTGIKRALPNHKRIVLIGSQYGGD